MNMNNMRIRPDSTDNPQVGEFRHNLYKAVMAQYNKALKKGFYIESVSLIESITSDRLESLANKVSGSKRYSYKTLGELLKYLKKPHSFSSPMMQALNDIDVWRENRNQAIHEMAKLDNAKTDFTEKYNKIKEYAEEGMLLFRLIDNHITKYLKQTPKTIQQ